MKSGAMDVGRPPTPLVIGVISWADESKKRQSPAIWALKTANSVWQQHVLRCATVEDKKWQTPATMALEGYQKDTKRQPRGDQNTSKNEDPKKVSIPSASGRGGRAAHLQFLSTFGATWSTWALNFGAH